MIDICIANGNIVRYKDNEYNECVFDETGILIIINSSEKAIYNRDYVQYFKISEQKAKLN